MAEAARAALKADSRLPADRIKVIVERGWVTYSNAAKQDELGVLAGLEPAKKRVREEAAA